MDSRWQFFKGAIVQSLIWLVSYHAFFYRDNSILFKNPYLIFYIAFILILFYFYFFDLLLNSFIFKVLSEKYKIVKSRLNIIRYLTFSQLYLEITSKAFVNEKNDPSYNKMDLLEFKDVKDVSMVKKMSLFDLENKNKSKLIVIKVNVNFTYFDKACEDEVNNILEDIKIKTSLKDKFSEVKTNYYLKGISKDINVFSIMQDHNPILNKILLIISYVILIGEVYKFICYLFIETHNVDISKEINRKHANIGSFVQNIDEDDELKRVLLRDYDNDDKHEVNIIKNNNNEHLVNIGCKKDTDYLIIKKEDDPKINNFDPLFKEKSFSINQKFNPSQISMNNLNSNLTVENSKENESIKEIKELNKKLYDSNSKNEGSVNNNCKFIF